jgi:hypothetical protein
MEVLHRGAMLVVIHTKEHCEKGMKVSSLMGSWFVFKTDWTDGQFVGVYCETNEEDSTLGPYSRMRK